MARSKVKVTSSPAQSVPVGCTDIEMGTYLTGCAGSDRRKGLFLRTYNGIVKLSPRGRGCWRDAQRRSSANYIHSTNTNSGYRIWNSLTLMRYVGIFRVASDFTSTTITRPPSTYRKSAT